MERELQQAREKLALLIKKRNGAKEAGKLDLEADITYYAIPETTQQIENLEREKQEDERKNPALYGV